jgi:hypothetical protein
MRLRGVGPRRAYPKLIYYNRLDKGGHFAAWEQPELFVNETRAAFRSLRQDAKTSILVDNSIKEAQNVK